eukprot:2170454-Pyramimonas_sp.AAC.1
MKCEREVAEGHARWRALDDSCVLSVRFPADEGWIMKQGKAQTSPGEVVQRDTLDSFLAVLCK